MAEKHAERRDRIGQQAAQDIFIREHSRRFLAQPQQFRAQIVLHLGAIKTSVDRERGNHVGAVQDAMVLFDVLEFDREAIRGRLDFMLASAAAAPDFPARATSGIRFR